MTYGLTGAPGAKVRRIVLVVVGLAVMTIGADGVHASPGDIDPSFSTDGFALAEAQRPEPEPDAVAVQPDGKVVMAFQTTVRHPTTVAYIRRYVARFNRDGSIDEAFANDGIFKVPGHSQYLPVAMDVAVQPSGRILVTPFGGGGGDGFSLIGLTPSGALDASFGGGDGFVTQELDQGYIDTEHIAARTDGRIVLAGSYRDAPESGYAIARLLADGDFDPSFAGEGWTAISSPELHPFGPYGVAVRDDGRIALLGEVYDGSAVERPVAVLQLEVDGDLDPTFADQGIAIVNFPGSDREADLALDPQGRLLVAVSGTSTLCEALPAVLRLNEAGELDASFGDDGIVDIQRPSVHTPCPTQQFPQLAVDVQGRPLLATVDRGLVLGRLTQSGEVDTSFAHDGWSFVYGRRTAFTHGPSGQRTGDLVVSEDGILVSVTAHRRGSSEPALGRFELGDGIADADGDGDFDAEEKCWQVYGDCPRLRRKIIVKRRGERRVFGPVASQDGCDRSGRILAFEKRPGRDRRRGAYSARRYGRGIKLRGRGTFYLLTRKVRLPYGVCPRVRSNLIEVPRGRNRGPRAGQRREVSHQSVTP